VLRRFAAQSGRFLDQFDEDAVGGTRVDEGDEPTASASAWLGVDQLEASLPETAHLGADVLDREREVV